VKFQVLFSAGNIFISLSGKSSAGGENELCSNRLIELLFLRTYRSWSCVNSRAPRLHNAHGAQLELSPNQRAVLYYYHHPPNGDLRFTIGDQRSMHGEKLGGLVVCSIAFEKSLNYIYIYLYIFVLKQTKVSYKIKDTIYLIENLICICNFLK